MLTTLTSILLFIAWLILLLVSLSVPITKSVFLFRLIGSASTSFLHSSASASATFGVWGYCVSSLDLSSVSIFPIIYLLHPHIYIQRCGFQPRHIRFMLQTQTWLYFRFNSS